MKQEHDISSKEYSNLGRIGSIALSSNLTSPDSSTTQTPVTSVSIPRISVTYSRLEIFSTRVLAERKRKAKKEREK